MSKKDGFVVWRRATADDPVAMAIQGKHVDLTDPEAERLAIALVGATPWVPTGFDPDVVDLGDHAVSSGVNRVVVTTRRSIIVNPDAAERLALALIRAAARARKEGM